MKTTPATAPKGNILTGKVVSTKMKETIAVSIASFKKHPKYGKFVKREHKILAHDAGNTKKMGETVTIVETRPISRRVRFIVTK